MFSLFPRLRISLNEERGQVVFLRRFQRGGAALFQQLHHPPGKRSKFRRPFPATLRASREAELLNSLTINSTEVP